MDNFETFLFTGEKRIHIIFFEAHKSLPSANDQLCISYSAVSVTAHWPPRED